MEQTTRTDAARGYIARGWTPIALPPGVKRPVDDRWNDTRWIGSKDPALARAFAGPCNVGILLGEPSGWLVDVDLDCPEAVELAAGFLPPTDCVTGREGNERCHRWYRSPGCETKQFRNAARKMMLEVRSTGCQTVVWPSTHPDGGLYLPFPAEAPPLVAPSVLIAAAESLAIAVLARRGEAPLGQRKPGTPPPKPLVARDLDQDAVLARARLYLAAIPPAISGAGGHAQTYAAATSLVHGFELRPDAALRLLAEEYNPRCMPPWTMRELEHKVNDAFSKPHARPRGWLRDERLEAVENFGVVDISALMPGALDEPAGEFPADLLEVPGFVGALAAHICATAHRPQPILALAAALALQAVLAGRKVRDPRGNRTNLYMVGVAPSGYGKDHPRKIVKRLLFESGLDQHEGHEDLASDAGLVAAVHQEPAILFQLDEFGRFLKTIGDAKRAPHLFNVLTCLMRLYSSADGIFRGKAYADLRQGKTVDQPCVCLFGTTTPEHFYEALTEESLQDGFLARLLVFEVPDATPPRRHAVTEELPQALVDHCKRWGGRRMGPGNLGASVHPSPVLVGATPGAERRWGELGELVDLEQSKDPFGRALWARAEEKACRLALVRACSISPENPLVEAEDADWAARLAEHLTRRTLRAAAAWVAYSRFDRLQKDVMRQVERLGGEISRGELVKRLRHLAPREREDLTRNLLETGQLEVVDRQPGPNGGRPTTVLRMPGNRSRATDP